MIFIFAFSVGRTKLMVETLLHNRKHGMDQQSKPITTVRSSTHTARKMLSVLIALLLIGASAFTGYYGQHQKVTSLNASATSADKNISELKNNITFLKAQQSELSKQVTSLSTKNSNLNSQLLKAKSSSVSASTGITEAAAELAVKPPAEPVITVLGAQKYVSPVNPKYPGIVVDVSITNPGTTSLIIPITNFKLYDELKDQSTDFAKDAGTTMENGYVVLNDLTLEPGQKVSGALVFDVLYPNFLKYSLGYGDKTYPVTID